MEEKQVPQTPNLLEEVRTPICRHFYLWQVVYHMASTRLFTILPNVYLPKAIYHLTGFPSTTYVNVCADGDGRVHCPSKRILVIDIASTFGGHRLSLRPSHYLQINHDSCNCKLGII